MQYKLTKRQHAILCDALRRALTVESGEPLDKAFTGLGTQAQFRPVAGRYMKPVRSTVRMRGEREWWRLVGEGLVIVRDWLARGYTAADIDAGRLPPMEEGQPIRKPSYYKCPYRSRAAMIEFLNQHAGHCDSHESAKLAWNVKAYDTDLSFEHLLAVYKRDGDDSDALSDPSFVEFAKGKYDRVKEQLWEYGVEDACQVFLDKDQATFQNLWDGTPLDVEYGFMGRSGGWLIIRKFGHRSFTARHWSECDSFEEMPFAELARLCRLVIMLDHDLTHKSASDAIETAAAYCFFANICEADEYEPPRAVLIETEL